MLSRRIKWLEAQLEEFEPALVAEIGGRVRGAMGDFNACDPYERALTITLDVLEHRRDRALAGGVRRRWQAVVMGSWDQPAAAALTGSCLACQVMHSVGHVMLEPAA